MTQIEHEIRIAEIRQNNLDWLRNVNDLMADKIARQNRHIRELSDENAALKNLLSRLMLANEQPVQPSTIRLLPVARNADCHAPLY
jgi:hypothetical protein